ncbi:MAG: hypothetical protein HY549_08970 [Elusimicrobia bacterium]|nr:hypothetical protein [Elusimicrobiota bacterium]
MLREIKVDPLLRLIPVIVLTNSQAERDVREAYQLGANCFFPKPSGIDQLSRLCRAIEEHWLVLARLPKLSRQP